MRNAKRIVRFLRCLLRRDLAHDHNPNLPKKEEGAGSVRGDQDQWMAASHISAAALESVLTKKRWRAIWAQCAAMALVGVVAILMIATVYRQNSVPVLRHLFEHSTWIPVTIVSSAKLESIFVTDTAPYINPPGNAGHIKSIGALAPAGFRRDNVFAEKLFDCRNLGRIEIVSGRKRRLHRPLDISGGQIAAVFNVNMRNNNMPTTIISPVWAYATYPNADVCALKDSGVHFLSRCAISRFLPQFVGRTRKCRRIGNEPGSEEANKETFILVHKIDQPLKTNKQRALDVAAILGILAFYGLCAAFGWWMAGRQ